MTCIVGLVHNDKAYLGGDSLAIDSEHNAYIQKHPKVFTINEYLIGFAGIFRLGQLLQYKFHPPVMTKKDQKDVHKFMCTAFIDSITTLVKPENHEVDMIVGVKGKIFQIQDDLSIIECSANIASIGSGDKFAIGSLFSTKGQEPEDRIRTALKAAAFGNAGVSEPFHIIRE